MKILPRVSNSIEIQFENGLSIEVREFGNSFKISAYPNNTLRLLEKRDILDDSTKDKTIKEDFDFEFKKGRTHDKWFKKLEKEEKKK